jgi:oligopeptide/dipeptide ABC transporter ATP-binding protein
MLQICAETIYCIEYLAADLPAGRRYACGLIGGDCTRPRALSISAFLFMSLDIATVKYLAHRIAVMYLGVIVEEADNASLFAAPRHPYTRALLSSVPVPDPDFRHERLLLKGGIPSPTKAYVGCRLRSRCPLAEAVCSEPVPRRGQLSSLYL